MRAAALTTVFILLFGLDIGSVTNKIHMNMNNSNSENASQKLHYQCIHCPTKNVQHSLNFTSKTYEKFEIFIVRIYYKL